MTDKSKIPRNNMRYRKVDGEIVSPCEIMGPVIIDLIRAGMNPSRAAQACAIGKSTLSGWVSRGIAEQTHIDKGGEPNHGEKPYLEFIQNMQKAESEAMGALVLSWFKEARAGDWKAAERFLARRWPDEWGDSNTVRVEVSGGLGMSMTEPPVVATLQEDEERKRAILSALVEAGDLPSNVLSAWDGDKDADVIDAEVIDEQ